MFGQGVPWRRNSCSKESRLTSLNEVMQTVSPGLSPAFLKPATSCLIMARVSLAETEREGSNASTQSCHTFCQIFQTQVEERGTHELILVIFSIVKAPGQNVFCADLGVFWGKVWHC